MTQLSPRSGAGDGSITLILMRARSGDHQAIGELVNRFLMQLVEAAKLEFGEHPRKVVDEEDVAMVVLAKLIDKLQRGKCVEVRDRDGLWGLMIRMTQQRVEAEINRMMTARNGYGMERTVSDLPEEAQQRLGRLCSDALNGEHVAIFREQVEEIMQELPDDTFRTIAKLKLEGASDLDIAYEMKTVPRNVSRKLKIIQVKWQTKLHPDSESGPELN